MGFHPAWGGVFIVAGFSVWREKDQAKVTGSGDQAGLPTRPSRTFLLHYSTDLTHNLGHGAHNPTSECMIWTIFA